MSNDPYTNETCTFICGDPACETKWGGDPETFPCEIEGCKVIGCGDCHGDCFNCGLNICSQHAVKVTEDGKQNFWCTNCEAERKALADPSQGTTDAVRERSTEAA